MYLKTIYESCLIVALYKNSMNFECNLENILLAGLTVSVFIGLVTCAIGDILHQSKMVRRSLNKII